MGDILLKKRSIPCCTNGFKILFILISMNILFSSIIVGSGNSGNSDEKLVICYNSKFFSLYLNNGEYYGCENHELILDIESSHINSDEIISFKLTLLPKVSRYHEYTIEKHYIYNPDTQTIFHENHSIVGKIPIFLKPNLKNEEKITLAEVNNLKTEGTFFETDKTFALNIESVKFNYILVDGTYGRYTCYYYTNAENLLIYWEIGNTREITLESIFGIDSFFGDIKLSYTSLNLVSTFSEYFINIILIITSAILLVISLISLTVVLIKRKILGKS